MKKILILESNNQLIDSQINTMDKPNYSELEELRSYMLSAIDFSGFNELEVFFGVMKWVNTRWKHDGLNDAGNISSLDILKRASKGECFRCVEFAKVTKDILLSMGYIARTISIESENADYGGFGQSHVVTEVWSNHLKKWIFLDPQLSCYAMKDNTPLSFYEISKSIDYTSFIFLGDESKIDENDYRAFIKNYLGYMRIDCILNGIKTQVYLHLRGKRQLLAFQAMQLSNAVFTKKIDEIYFNPNNTAILFEYKDSIDANKIIKENNLTSVEELEENIDLFCVKPNFELTFVTNTPNFDHYEFQINEDEPIKITNNTYDWSMNEGTHRIKVCSVNKQGIKGCLTEMVILYNT